MPITTRSPGLAVVAAVVLAALIGCGTDPSSTVVTADRSGSPTPDTPSASASPSVSASASRAAVPVPKGVSAGIAVYDRRAGAFTVQQNIDQRFRSASLVKLFIAIDYLWDREVVPTGDRQRLDLMLSRSDDNAASHFYDRGGRAAIIARMNKRLGWPAGDKGVVPPTAPRTGWGSTEVSAAHILRVYRYLLDEAPSRIGTYVLDRLRQGTFTRCGTDGYDQSFGVPTAFKGRPWAAKQGWYEFRNAPRTCTSGTPAALVEPVHPTTALMAAPVDWTGEALHTTGVVGPDDRTIVVVLTVHPRGTSYATATGTVTQLAGSLPLTAG